MTLQNTQNSPTPAFQFAELISRAQRTGLNREGRFAQLLTWLQLDPDDIEIRELVTEALEQAELEALVSPNPFRATNPLSPAELPGIVGLGLIPPNGVPWTIPPDLLTNNLLVTGRSGGGKTNLVLLILAQLLQQGYSIKVFDRKRDYQALTVSQSFIYWLFDHYHTNWLQPPPGVSFLNWVHILAEILSNYLDIRLAARTLFTSIALKLNEESDSETRGVYPTIRDIYRSLTGMRFPAISHTARYQETLANRLRGLIDLSGDHICSHRQLDWNMYANSSWAISLDGIPTDYQNLFITVDTAKILTHRIANNLRSSALSSLLVFDEGSTVFRKWHETREGIYLLADYLAKCREFGIGFLIGTQSLSNLADSVLANTGTKILVGGAGLGADYDIFASATGMTQSQKEYLKQLTVPGMACAKDPRYPFPFTLEVPCVVQ